ncbi:alpha/beta fold hydrolase [Liquorilactobacillus capillatus]|uniref:Alpha beta fold family hydrolase n=1 Tax=Liquorilactobacillus capillatus DSM 19910 TaxID=1423731 RepID=A0A0R1M0L6_9LACO|nr:alpha/beta hydrolase [Liquorilactobacillus capillatus]KRL01153.1 alpha beta fold family hydrolase [Liquorilactobacillus capillatus DSM 19910]
MQKLIDNTLIHYQIVGKGETIVFLHGLCLDLTSMKLSYQHLLASTEYQQIYIDLPGMGESSTFLSPQPTGDYLIKLIIKLLDTIKVNEFYLGGHSYGGYLSLGIAYNCPKRVKGIFLTCPVITANRDKRKTAHHLNIKKDDFDLPKSKYASDFLEMNTVITKTTWKNYLRKVISGLEKCDFSFIKKLQEHNYQNYQLQEEENIKRWQPDIPLFLLLGKHDQIVGFKEQVRLDTNFKNSSLLILENAGHNLPIDQPEIFASCVKSFFTT